MKRSTGNIAPEERGDLFEGLVAQLLRAYKDYRNLCDEIYYWTPSGRSETKVAIWPFQHFSNLLADNSL